jgi:hypothetical protein
VLRGTILSSLHYFAWNNPRRGFVFKECPTSSLGHQTDELAGILHLTKERQGILDVLLRHHM